MPLESFWLKRYSNDWLVGKTACILFAVSCFFILVVTPILFGLVNVPNTTLWGNLLSGVLGVAGGLSIPFLWVGMWSYWLRVDRSTRKLKRLWFFVLLVGFWYGSILYFLLKYLWIDKRVMGKPQFERCQ